MAESSRDLSPSLAHVLHHPVNEDAFFWCDRVMVEGGLQVLMISFSALLGGTTVHMLRDADPVVWALAADEEE